MTATKSKGFEISFDDSFLPILKTRLWGLWDEEFAKRYERMLLKKIEEIGGNGKEWYVLADFTAFYPQSQEVQYITCEYLTVATQQGLKGTIYLGKMVELQPRFKSLFREQDLPPPIFVESEEEAIQCLLKD